MSTVAARKVSVQDKFAATRQELRGSLIERDDEIDLALTALVCQEHLLLVGPPGTAKSLLADKLVRWLNGKKFSVQVNKFTDPAELFGPISLTGLKTDRYSRVTRDYLPEADIAFIDEIFKSSSAVLNSLLSVLNERKFKNDGVHIDCPLKLCIAASNEWPGDQNKELGALFDRFLFRKSVRPIASEKSLRKLLWTDDLDVKLSTSITSDEIHAATGEAASISFSTDCQDAYHTILRTLKKEGIVVGDRRLKKSISACRASAWLDGADEVSAEHLEVLSHLLWEEPIEQPKKVAEIVGSVANPNALKVNSLLIEAEQLIGNFNCSDIGKATAATKKLGAIAKELGTITGPKASQASTYVKDEIKRLRLLSLESVE
jgi:MoxR-like ATPase